MAVGSWAESLSCHMDGHSKKHKAVEGHGCPTHALEGKGRWPVKHRWLIARTSNPAQCCSECRFSSVLLAKPCMWDALQFSVAGQVYQHATPVHTPSPSICILSCFLHWSRYDPLSNNHTDEPPFKTSTPKHLCRDEDPCGVLHAATN